MVDNGHFIALYEYDKISQLVSFRAKETNYENLINRQIFFDSYLENPDNCSDITTTLISRIISVWA